MSTIHDDSSTSQTALLHLPDAEGSGLIFIEQVSASSLKTCKNGARPTLLTWSQSERLAVVWRPDCKMWSCPVCGERRRLRLVALGYHGASRFILDGRRIGFVTLTSHEKLGAYQSMKVWPDAWNKLQNRLRRAVADPQYLFVPELHKTGKMHAHGLVVDAPEKRWWKDNARASGFGYQDDMQEAESLRVVGYLAKYTAKTLEHDKFPRGTRRFRTSQGWPKLATLEAGGDLTTRKLDPSKTLSEQTHELQSEGYAIAESDSGLIWTLFEQTRNRIKK